MPDFDPGIAALAMRQLSAISTVPFDGPFRHYRGYLFQTADGDFKQAYGAAIRRGVPASVLTANPWMLPFSGVMGPSEFLSIGGERYVWASSCRPHDCPDGNIYLLYDPVRKIAWGAAHSDARTYLFGDPSAEHEALLLAITARSLIAPDEPFPLGPGSSSTVRRALQKSSGSIEMLVSENHL